MSGSGAALVSIPLRDGTQLSVTPAGIQLGAAFIELARIQDARQVAPDPETFALRAAGTGLVEFQPIRPGDGAIALEALFRMRPDLRPAGFIGPSEGHGYPLPPPPPSLPYPSAPGFPPPYPPPPGAYPPDYGYAPAAAPRVMYAPSPNAQQGELTPYPRSFGELLSAIFQLYGKHFRKWLALGFWVILLPGLLIASAEVGVQMLLGVNPFVASPTAQAITIGSNCLPQIPAALTHDLVVGGAIAAGSIILSMLFSAWQTASFANAGREAILGRSVPIGASLNRGAQRLLPTLGTSIVVALALFAALVPGIVCYVISFAGLFGSASGNLCATQNISTSSASTSTVSSASSVYLLLSCAGFLLIAAGCIFSLFLAVRLIVAPVIAATERVGIGTALSKSWRLTYRSWWRCFGVIFVIGLVVVLFTLAFSALEAVPLVVVTIVAAPLAQWIISPLQELTYIVLLYDLRLRREGYAAITQQAAPVPAGTTSYRPPYEPPPPQG